MSVFILIFLAGFDSLSQKCIAVRQSEEGKAYLTYGGEALFAFGPGDELRLLSGAADVERWAQWQHQNGMNLVRAYPTLVPLEAYGTPGLAPFVRKDGRWDVDVFDEAYFANLNKTVKLLERYNIIVHLQLWQIVFFKDGEKRWDINFLNPRNNRNEWTQVFVRGADYIDAPAGSKARMHQRNWAFQLLNAVKGRRNVFIDIINELGNTMGTLEWAVEVSRWVREWQSDNGQFFVVGVDSEHHYNEQEFGKVREHFDIVILNELRTPDYARRCIEMFNMPAVSVRSSDGTNRWEDYMFANSDQVGLEHQIRYRTLCYRSLFSGLQSIGAYWKLEVHEADYKGMHQWQQYAQTLRKIWRVLAPYWPTFVHERGAARIIEAIAPYTFSMACPEMIAIYLEGGPKSWNKTFPESILRIHCVFSDFVADYYNTTSGEVTRIPGKWTAPSEAEITLPAFLDDAVVLVRNIAQ